MITTAANLLALAAVLSGGVGSRGPLKFSSVTISKVRKSYWSASVTYPRFQAYTPVTTVANKQLLRFSNSSLHDWATRLTKDMEKPDVPWIEEVTPTVVTTRSDLVSLQMTQYTNMGGPHPTSILTTFNFGVVGTGAKLLTLKDLFKPGIKPLPIVSKIVIAKLKNRNASSVMDGTVKALDAKQGDMFVIKPDRLTYVFSAYEMASYAEGPFEIDVPFASLAKNLNPNGPLRGFLHH